MMKFNREEGLTLIELLITISVLAIVSAIALPVINNVVTSSNSNALVQTQSDVADFIAKYNAAGETLFNSATNSFEGYVDTDGDNTIEAGEKVDSLTLDSKFTIQGGVALVSTDNVGGSYDSDAVSVPTIVFSGN